MHVTTKPRAGHRASLSGFALKPAEPCQCQDDPPCVATYPNTPIARSANLPLFLLGRIESGQNLAEFLARRPVLGDPALAILAQVVVVSPANQPVHAPHSKIVVILDLLEDGKNRFVRCEESKMATSVPLPQAHAAATGLIFLNGQSLLRGPPRPGPTKPVYGARSGQRRPQTTGAADPCGHPRTQVVSLQCQSSPARAAAVTIGARDPACPQQQHSHRQPGTARNLSRKRRVVSATCSRTLPHAWPSRSQPARPCSAVQRMRRPNAVPRPGQPSARLGRFRNGNCLDRVQSSQ